MSAPEPPTPPSPSDGRLEAFAERVRTSPHNLVSRRARDELLTRHIPECIAFAQMLPSGSHRVLDLGSGGGFPGMVVACVRTDLEVHLLDATAKKTEFLREVALELGIPTHVHTGRAEDRELTATLGGTFHVVTARAVASLDRLIGWSMPYLRPGGLLYAMKGERWREELDEAAPALARHGASIVATPDDVPSVDGGTGNAPRVVIVARGPR